MKKRTKFKSTITLDCLYPAKAKDLKRCKKYMFNSEHDKEQNTNKIKTSNLPNKKKVRKSIEKQNKKCHVVRS